VLTFAKKFVTLVIRSSSSFVIVLALTLIMSCPAQTSIAGTVQAAPEKAGTNTDLFMMFGSDFDRPGLHPRANYNIGIGHTFGSLKNDLIGDELTFSYTYENSGTRDFFHTNFGEHTETTGTMKNFGIRKQND